MKTNFSPQLNYNPLAAVQAGAGLLQSIIGGIKAGKAQKQLEKMQSPTYNQSKGILNYYNEALGRYGVSPTQSAMYKRQMGNIDRQVATGVGGLQDRRSTLAGIPGLLRASSDAKLNTEVAAENQRNQRFGELGQAAGMKAGEEMKDYQFNQIAPFERKYNLLAMKAGGANQLANAGLSNIFGGLQNLSNYNLYQKEFGTGKGESGAGYGYGANGLTGINTDYLMRTRKMKLPK